MIQSGLHSNRDAYDTVRGEQMADVWRVEGATEEGDLAGFCYFHRTFSCVLRRRWFEDPTPRILPQ